MYLDGKQVRKMCRESMLNGDPLTLVCIRKTDSKDGTKKAGDRHTLITGKIPSPILKNMKAKGTNQKRREEDLRNNVQTIWEKTKCGWRRVNLAQVVSVTYKSQTYFVQVV